MPKKPKQDIVAKALAKFSVLGDVTSRSMFGGHGLYYKGVMFGLIAYDVVYLKVGKTNLEQFQKAKQKPFVYTGKQGKPMEMSYWTIPKKVWDSPTELLDWATGAYQVNSAKKK